jgi:hypothetical protein
MSRLRADAGAEALDDVGTGPDREARRRREAAAGAHGGGS